MVDRGAVKSRRARDEDSTLNKAQSPQQFRRATLQIDDGALIHMTFTGVRDDENHYLRTLPRFETAAPKYAFLNRLLAVGIGEIRPEGPVHAIEEIL